MMIPEVLAFCIVPGIPSGVGEVAISYFKKPLVPLSKADER